MGLRKPAPSALHPVREREHARDLPGLLEQLKNPDPSLRRWAARDLGAHAEAAAALGRALAGEREPSVREALFTSLSTLASESAAEALMPLLRSEDAALRNGAIEALAGMPQAVAPSIERLLHDPDPDVRIFTVNLLGELRHSEVNRWLSQVLAQESQVNVVAAAIEVLAETGGAAERPGLLRVRERFADDPFIGFATELALDRIEAP